MAAGRADSPPLLSIPEVARLTGLKRSTLYDRAHRGELPGAVRFGGGWVVRRDDLERVFGIALGERKPAAMSASEV